MKQRWFLSIAALIPACFAVVMLASPGSFLTANGMNGGDPALVFMMRSVAALLLCTVPAIWASRNDPGSPAMKGALVGLVLLSFGPSVLDIMALSQNLINHNVIGSIVMRAIIGVFAIILLMNLGKKPAPAAAKASKVPKKKRK